MLVDPVDALKKHTTTLGDLLPTSTIATPTALPTFHRGHEVQHATETGMRTLWVVFVIMLLSTVAFTGMAWRVPVKNRLFHTITTFIVMIAALSYFAMATGHGVAFHKIHYHEHHKHVGSVPHHLTRQVFWQRYVDWALTTPLLLLDLAFLAGANGFTILTVIVADLVMILTGLFAAFGAEETPQKWGWYAIACIAYVVLVWQMVVSGRATAAARGNKVGSFFASLAGFTFILWTAYPIVWGVADGARHLSVDQEIIAYAVLDVLAKPVFGLWLLFTHSRMPESNVDLSGFWTHGLGADGQIRIGDDEDGA